MTAKVPPWQLPFLYFFALISYSSSSPQNIQTFYPFSITHPPPPPSPPQPPPTPPPPQTSTPPPPSPTPDIIPLPTPPSSSKGKFAKAVVATAAGTAFVSALFFCLVVKCRDRKKGKVKKVNPYAEPYPELRREQREEFGRLDSRIKGIIVDENGLDVLYWKQLQGDELETNSNKQFLGYNFVKDEERQVPETPLLPGIGMSSAASHFQDESEKEEKDGIALPPPSFRSSSEISLAGMVIHESLPPHSNPHGSKSSVKPPPPPPPPPSEQASSSGTGNDSNGLHKGSFKSEDDLMEALFGYIAANRKSPKRFESSSSIEKSFILNPTKSQNIAIIIQSLDVSREQLMDSIIKGHGLNLETLERLTRIAPTHEEEAAILQFNGDPEKLADAESFLYHLLKSIPAAFPRLSAMLFRTNYATESQFLKESLQTVEKACQELRTPGLFLKLVESILKAGNRMNDGTTRGNARGLDITVLTKLCDVKSIDGKTTLLHFVLEEVVRLEGKRCLVNRSRSISRTNTQNSTGSIPSNRDREKEYIMLGLPVVGGLSSEFEMVKKTATIDYDTLSKTYPSLTPRLNQIQQILKRVGFDKEMKRFLKLAEQELRILKQEQEKVMELLRKTKEYYQTGTSKENEANPLRLFVIIKDFLGMVDQTCIEIARNIQKKRSGSDDSPVDRRSIRFPKLPPNFMLESSNRGHGLTEIGYTQVNIEGT